MMIKYRYCHTICHDTHSVMLMLENNQLSQGSVINTSYCYETKADYFIDANTCFIYIILQQITNNTLNFFLQLLIVRFNVSEHPVQTYVIAAINSHSLSFSFSLEVNKTKLKNQASIVTKKKNNSSR